MRDPRPDADVRVRLQGLHDALTGAGILDPALRALWRVARRLGEDAAHRAGLLPVRYLHELDAPLDADAIEEVVAELQAETDDDLEETGCWDVTCHVQGAEDGLWGVSFDDAMAFARRFTDVIRIRDYSAADRTERFYSAGSRPIPGLPAWWSRP